MNKVLKGYLRLMRPANLPTAMADVFAGVAISGAVSVQEFFVFQNPITIVYLVYLLIASTLLYAGGVVLNDVFDYKLDVVERPERPLPSGLIKVKFAALFGAVLLLFGVVFAFLVNATSGCIAVGLAFAIVFYNAIAKKSDFFGPVNMGVCRALNLILGMSIFTEVLYWWYAVIPLVYIFAITLISRGEVHGNNKKNLIYAGVLYSTVVVLLFAFQYNYMGVTLKSIPFVLLFAYLIFKPLIHAYKNNSPGNIKKAVIGGVLSVVVLDAAIAVGFAHWSYALLILLLLPLSKFLSKLFAVT